MNLRFDNKVALVVGGTRGIGKEVVFSLAKLGAKVIFTGRTKENAENLLSEAKRYNLDLKSYVFDVANINETNKVINEIVDDYGKLDILVANAGINPLFKRAEQLTANDWDMSMSINLRGLFFAIQSAGKHMLDSGQGSIVSISSATSVIGVPRGLPYVATKGGLDSMTRTLAVEWADRGVRVNGVAPGYIDTDLTQGIRDNESLNKMMESSIPLGRFGKIKEVANLILYLASDEAKYTTGQTYIIDGGLTVQ